MSVPVERCEDCRHYHQPGPCYPTDEERNRDDGWRLYRAMKTQAFPKADPEPDLKEGQQ